MLASASSATGIKSTSVYSLTLKTWCTVQLLRSFCSSLAWHSRKPKIGDCSLTAASDHWSVFCYTTAASLPLYPSLTRLHWRRSMKQWSMCWRKVVMISISGLFALNRKWWTFCWDNSLASPSIHVFCAFGIVGTVLRITRRRTAFARGIGALQWKERYKRPSGGQIQNTLPTTAHQARLNQAVHQGSEQGWCLLHLGQAFPEFTLEKLKAGIFDGPQIQQLIRDPEFENSMDEVELEARKAFVLVVKNFLGNNKIRKYAEFVNNMLIAFRNMGCNISIKMHYLISQWTGFLRTWVQWVTNRGRDSIRT